MVVISNFAQATGQMLVSRSVMSTGSSLIPLRQINMHLVPQTVVMVDFCLVLFDSKVLLAEMMTGV